MGMVEYFTNLSLQYNMHAENYKSQVFFSLNFHNVSTIEWPHTDQAIKQWKYDIFTDKIPDKIPLTINRQIIKHRNVKQVMLRREHEWEENGKWRG
jgi:hypothetical protein